MKHKITKRLILYFSITLLGFALIIGILFSMLFMHYSKGLRASDLKKRAVSMADTISRMPDFEAEHGQHMSGMGNGSGMGSGMHHGMMRNSLRMLDEIAQSEVWIVDEQARTIELYQHGKSSAPDYDALPPEASEVIDEVFSGSVPVSENFSKTLGTPSVTAGAPICDENGNIVAALLLHRNLNDMNKAEHGGFIILAICLLTAFLLSIPLSILLARRFIQPLQRMEETAASLAAGDYTAQTGIEQDDEIGSLAQSLDQLSLRLDEASQESSRLDKMRQDFITNISHELRTPITVLRGSLEVLQAGLITEPAEKTAYLQEMMSNIIHLQRLVNDLLELTRLQNIDFVIEKAPINLTDALSDALHTARHLADSKGISLHFPDELPPIAFTADYGRIRQMFLIILDNAVKFSPAGSSIEISLQTGDDENWEIILQDHGCGIAPDELPHIFERFHRSTSASNPNGTGLGLAIANQIANRHGLFMSCESTLHEGTTFRFSKRQGNTD